MTKPQLVPAQQEEISEPTTSSEPAHVPFGRRLRIALEALDVGQEIVIRTKTERQHVTNVVSMVQKRRNIKLQTHLLRRRTDDPEGKIVISIKRIAVG